MVGSCGEGAEGMFDSYASWALMAVSMQTGLEAGQGERSRQRGTRKDRTEGSMGAVALG